MGSMQTGSSSVKCNLYYLEQSITKRWASGVQIMYVNPLESLTLFQTAVS